MILPTARILGDTAEVENLVQYITATRVGLRPMTATWDREGRRSRRLGDVEEAEACRYDGLYEKIVGVWGEAE